MQEIEESRQRLLKKQSSKLSRKLINEVADELHEKEMKMYKLIQAQNEGRKENGNRTEKKMSLRL
jgi:hypothetical protein